MTHQLNPLVMRKTLILSFLAAMMLATSCKKDPQEKLCDGIICLNGGVCVNGGCECPDRYTGPACATEVDPIKMKVGQIELTGFPATTSSGAGWDTFDGADVYLEILKGGVSHYKTNTVTNLTGAHTWSVNFEFTDPTATYVIRAVDDDNGITTDDYLGGITFTPYISGADFPTSYPVECVGCTVSFEFRGIQYFH